ncbi:TPA: MobA/MobL family protein, partial [Salmonella enterica subsp. enterica serovar Dublin]
MAIYHFSVQMISRGKGQSAIASAAYRSGEKLYDERSEQSKYYKRDVQPENHIL